MAWTVDESGLVTATGPKLSYTGTRAGGSKGNAIWIEEPERVRPDETM